MRVCLDEAGNQHLSAQVDNLGALPMTALAPAVSPT
jgi:hypothetical protein